MVPAFVTCERWFFKAGPWLRNERPVGSDITELLLLLKIAARKTVILSFGFVPSQHMRLNLYFVHHPGQHWCGSGHRTHKSNLELFGPIGRVDAVHIAFVRLGALGFVKDGQGFEDGQFALVIATYDVRHGFVDLDDGGGPVGKDSFEEDTRCREPWYLG
ncbi:hypothetical protein HBN65_10260 [Pseudomonas lundensis]|uniref:hypothetical protein n=1 Tax=Pseudomonas lundensis TaxID=86185 RepID=UPI00147379EA|nr:hypothetical protein [Pseudomonas lundensis]NNA07189.1 hypothetical protein [Pseudomonas lundensis]